jgi:predicted nucleotidyltransferase
MITKLLDQLQNKYPESNIYLYGSHVYGTNGEKSDYDFIVVGNLPTSSEKPEFGDLHFYSKEDFTRLLQEQEISALECYFLPPEFKRESFPLTWSLNLEQLRASCAQKASNSWVKAKKKLLVEQEPYIAQKSLFHSLRILHFAIELATTETLINFNSLSLWQEVQSLPLDWDQWVDHFKPQYNSLKSQFKKSAPKA